MDANAKEVLDAWQVAPRTAKLLGKLGVQTMDNLANLEMASIGGLGLDETEAKHLENAISDAKVRCASSSNQFRQSLSSFPSSASSHDNDSKAGGGFRSIFRRNKKDKGSEDDNSSIDSRSQASHSSRRMSNPNPPTNFFRRSSHAKNASAESRPYGGGFNEGGSLERDLDESLKRDVAINRNARWDEDQSAKGAAAAWPLRKYFEDREIWTPSSSDLAKANIPSKSTYFFGEVVDTFGAEEKKRIAVKSVAHVRADYHYVMSLLLTHTTKELNTRMASLDGSYSFGQVLRLIAPRNEHRNECYTHPEMPLCTLKRTCHALPQAKAMHELVLREFCSILDLDGRSYGVRTMESVDISELSHGSAGLERLELAEGSGIIVIPNGHECIVGCVLVGPPAKKKRMNWSSSKMSQEVQQLEALASIVDSIRVWVNARVSLYGSLDNDGIVPARLSVDAESARLKPTSAKAASILTTAGDYDVSSSPSQPPPSAAAVSSVPAAPGVPPETPELPPAIKVTVPAAPQELQQADPDTDSEDADQDPKSPAEGDGAPSEPEANKPDDSNASDALDLSVEVPDDRSVTSLANSTASMDSNTEMTEKLEIELFVERDKRETAREQLLQHQSVRGPLLVQAQEGAAANAPGAELSPTSHDSLTDEERERLVQEALELKRRVEESDERVRQLEAELAERKRKSVKLKEGGMQGPLAAAVEQIALANIANDQASSSAPTPEELDIVEKLQRRIKLLKEFLPPNMSEEDLDMTLEDAERRVQESLQVIMNGGDHDPAKLMAAEAAFEKWDSVVRNHPEYKRREAEKWVAWENDNRPKNEAALEEMRGLVKKEYFSLSPAQLEAKGMSKKLIQRVQTKRVFKLLYMTTDEIEKLHQVDLSVNCSTQGLDIVELRAVYAVVPGEFVSDATGKKNEWRENIKTKLDELIKKEANNSLRPDEKRHRAYRPDPPPSSVGGGRAGGLPRVGGGNGMANRAPPNLLDAINKRRGGGDDDKDARPKLKAPAGLLSAIQNRQAKAAGGEVGAGGPRPGPPNDLMSAIRGRNAGGGASGEAKPPSDLMAAIRKRSQPGDGGAQPPKPGPPNDLMAAIRGRAAKAEAQEGKPPSDLMAAIRKRAQNDDVDSSEGGTSKPGPPGNLMAAIRSRAEKGGAPTDQPAKPGPPNDLMAAIRSRNQLGADQPGAVASEAASPGPPSGLMAAIRSRSGGIDAPDAPQPSNEPSQPVHQSHKNKSSDGGALAAEDTQIGHTGPASELPPRPTVQQEQAPKLDLPPRPPVEATSAPATGAPAPALTKSELTPPEAAQPAAMAGPQPSTAVSAVTEEAPLTTRNEPSAPAPEKDAATAAPAPAPAAPAEPLPAQSTPGPVPPAPSPSAPPAKPADRMKMDLLRKLEKEFKRDSGSQGDDQAAAPSPVPSPPLRPQIAPPTTPSVPLPGGDASTAAYHEGPSQPTLLRTPASVTPPFAVAPHQPADVNLSEPVASTSAPQPSVEAKQVGSAPQPSVEAKQVGSAPHLDSLRQRLASGLSTKSFATSNAQPTDRSLDEKLASMLSAKFSSNNSS